MKKKMNRWKLGWEQNLWDLDLNKKIIEMLTKNISAFIYACLVLLAASSIAAKERYELQLLGLFTITNCTRGMEFECHNARVNQETVEKVHWKYINHYVALVHTCFKDIQNSSRILADTLLALATDERMYYEIPCDNSKQFSFLPTSPSV